DARAHRANARRAGLREHSRRTGPILRRHRDEAPRVAMARRAVAAWALVALAMPAGAAVLYKSVDSKGVVQFSDLPPPPRMEAKAIGVPETTAAVPRAS